MNNNTHPINSKRPPPLTRKYNLREYFEHGVVTSYQKDEWICGSESGPCDYIHYISYGYVKAYTETDKEHVHIIFKQNELFPILKLADSQDRRVRYNALSTTKIYSVHRSELLSQLDTDLKLAKNLLACTLHLYRIQADRVDNLEYQEAYQRVACRIIFLIARFGKMQADGSYLLSSIFTHRLIASTLNLSRESVSREILQLHDRKLIERSNGGLVVRDIKRFAAELKLPISTNIWGLLDNTAVVV